MQKPLVSRSPLARVAPGVWDATEPYAIPMSVADAKILLVIEERHEMRDELAEFFRGLGFIAIPAADTDSATVIVRKLRPDLILWHAVGTDAVATAVIAEWKARRPDTPVVAVARPSATGGEGLRRSGADAVVTGPVVLAHLERLVRQLLGLSERRPPAGA